MHNRPAVSRCGGLLLLSHLFASWKDDDRPPRLSSCLHTRVRPITGDTSPSCSDAPASVKLGGPITSGCTTGPNCGGPHANEQQVVPLPRGHGKKSAGLHLEHLKVGRGRRARRGQWTWHHSPRPG